MRARTIYGRAPHPTHGLARLRFLVCHLLLLPLFRNILERLRRRIYGRFQRRHEAAFGFFLTILVSIHAGKSMGGGSRGIKKPKLRDYSIRATPEEIIALRAAVSSRKDPLTCAILGAVMIEHELDRL